MGSEMCIRDSVKDENRVYPNFTRVNELKMVVAEKVFEVEEALANS